MIFLKNADFRYFIALSMMVFVLQTAYCYFIGFLNFLMLKILFIPVAVILGIIIIFKKLGFVKIFIFIALIFQSIVITSILVSLNYIQTHNDWYYQDFTSLADYAKAKNQILCKRCISHFPKSIPNNAKDIVFYQYASYFWGSEGIFLKFKTNSDYIQKEIKNYKYSNIEGPYDKEEKHSCCLKNSIHFKNNFLDIKGYKFYIIKNRKAMFQHSQMKYSFAVKDNTILYYYTKPD